MPATTHDEEVVDEFYENLENVLTQCKPHDINIIMGDFNAKVGSNGDGFVTGNHGLGNINDRGEKLIDWCRSKNQVIMNTWFQQHPRRLWTWRSPGGEYKNQIDYITINHRFRNSVKKVKTYPGSDCGIGCDHVPVVATVNLKLKKMKKQQKIKRDWTILKDENIKKEFQLKLKNRFEALEEEVITNDIENEWDTLQRALKETTETIVPKEKKRNKKKWMTEEITKLMEERSKWKTTDRDKYKDLDKEIKIKCKLRKEEWIKERCQEIEDLEKTNTQLMYEKVKEIAGKKGPPRGTIIQDEQGNILTEIEEVLERWERYVKQLFQDNNRNPLDNTGTTEMEGPNILNSEIKMAIKKMGTKKAEGEDEIVIEMIEAGGDIAIEKITKLANNIYNTGHIPDIMKKSTFIVIPKKAGTTDCSKHRTISIMSQVGKIILRVIMNRIRNKIQIDSDKEQFGFKSGKGTRNAIFSLRVLLERAIEKQKNVFMCFVDFQKAFDTIRHEDLMDMLKEKKIDGKDLRIIKNLYWNQTAKVKIGDNLSKEVEVQRGARQGCVLSPDMFTLYSEEVMSELKELEGIRIGGENINNLRYADDTVLIATNKKNLQLLVNKLNEACNRRGMKINIGKTEIMVATKKNETLNTEITLEGNKLKQVT